MHCWTDPLVRGEELPRWLDSKTFPSILSQRQWDSVDRQARAALDSWIELREDEFRRTVNGSPYDDEFKHQLHAINKRHAWWEPVDDEAHKMARRIIKHLRHRVPFPNMRKCRTMSMDGKIANVQQPVMAFHSQWWVIVSTLESGKPVRIPLMADPRLEHALHRNGETICNHLQATLPDDGSFTFHLLTAKPKAALRTLGDIIALDWGLKSMFSTSQGERHGLRLYDWLRKLDKQLTDLTRSLARSGIRYKKSRRYRNLNKRIHDHTVNEVNRILNQLTERDIREIVVEDLDFRDSHMSKQMNRIIRRAGRAAVRRKLKDLTDNQGITVTKVNAAYTSLECSHCGYVNKNNRPTQSDFRCKCCGLRLNADINASHNILERRSREDGWRKIGRKQILATLLREHDERYHPNTGGHADKKSTATPQAGTPAPEVKATNGIKYH